MGSPVNILSTTSQSRSEFIPASSSKEVIGIVPCNGGKPIQKNMFFATRNWTIKETSTLLDAQTKLFKDMKNGNLNAIFKTRDERWEYISKLSVQRGVLRSADQCLFRWDRISTLFKKVHDYERHIAFGCDSYWSMSTNQREEMKLPRNFSEDLYTTMLDRVGKERLINPGDIVYDTMQDNLGNPGASPSKASGLNMKEEKVATDKEFSSGKKHKRFDKMSVLKKELEDTTKQLISFMDDVDARREKHDDEIIELTKAEFEEAVTLNRKQLALEEESNEALKQIADAFKCFAVHASKSTF
ncbi:hypothetical protein L7F22_045430 [Adiantum nelumboides]|nr:hypothetical protein [Adiantum nelumboides]